MTRNEIIKALKDIREEIMESFDLTDFASTFSDVYTIPLDNGLRNITGATEARVTIEISGLTTKDFKVSNISYINNTAGFEATILSESLNVKLRGRDDLLSQVKAENIRAVADLTDFDESTGTYMAPVRIYVDGFTDVGALGEYSVSIEIRKVSG